MRTSKTITSIEMGRGRELGEASRDMGRRRELPTHPKGEAPRNIKGEAPRVTRLRELPTHPQGKSILAARTVMIHCLKRLRGA